MNGDQLNYCQRYYTVIATGFDQTNFASPFKKPEAKKEEEEVEMKPVAAPADIGEIDEIFKIFSR